MASFRGALLVGDPFAGSCWDHSAVGRISESDVACLLRGVSVWERLGASGRIDDVVLEVIVRVVVGVPELLPHALSLPHVVLVLVYALDELTDTTVVEELADLAALLHPALATPIGAQLVHVVDLTENADSPVTALVGELHLFAGLVTLRARLFRPLACSSEPHAQHVHVVAVPLCGLLDFLALVIPADRAKSTTVEGVVSKLTATAPVDFCHSVLLVYSNRGQGKVATERNWMSRYIQYEWPHRHSTNNASGSTWVGR